jgi:hypothetical protein
MVPCLSGWDYHNNNIFISVMQLFTTKVNKPLNMHAKCHSLGDSQKYYVKSIQEEKNNY